MMTRWLLVAVAALFCAPAAHAQLNQPLELRASYGFDDPEVDGALTFVSGRMHADLQARGEAWGLFDVQGLELDGVTRYCPQMGTAADCRVGSFRLVARDGGSVGLHLPNARADVQADHALAFFMKARGDDLQGMQLNESLVAPLVNGVVGFEHVRAPRIPLLDDRTQCLTFLGKVAALNDDTRIDVFSGDQRIDTVSRGRVACFSGADIQVRPFSAWAIAAPFDHGSQVDFRPASSAAAREGIELQRITRVQQLIAAASVEAREQRDRGVEQNALLDSLSEVLNAAVLRVPADPQNSTTEDVRRELAIILFETVQVQNQNGELRWEGQAAMQYREGELKGAQALFGFWWFQLPWWGWLLWFSAIVLFAIRVAVRPPLWHDRWDRLRWIGWLAGTLVFGLVFVLWDLEMRTVWGTSVLTTDNAGTAFWITFAIQLGTMSFILGAVAWPLSIVIKNSLLLARQGTFMGLGKPLSLLLAYLIGATLLLAYLELFIERVAERLGSG